MKLDELTASEIEKFKNRKGARKIAVENFLMSMGTDAEAAIENLIHDAQLYHWNEATIQAIEDGIKLAGLKRYLVVKVEAEKTC